LRRRRESPTTRRAGGLDFSAIGGKIQRHGSALIGAGVTGCKAPGLKSPNDAPVERHSKPGPLFPDKLSLSAAYLTMIKKDKFRTMKVAEFNNLRSGQIDNQSQSGYTPNIFDREDSDQPLLLQHRNMAEVMFGHQG